MQKYTQLKLQPDRLITDGLFARVRNINYFGEFLIYFSLALLAVSWLAFIPLVIFIVFFWTPNMRRKERSLARYPEFTEYKRRTKWFFPSIF
jgi:protein-S-isoprenylcysteine O-methyltransferase Ste14